MQWNDKRTSKKWNSLELLGSVFLILGLLCTTTSEAQTEAQGLSQDFVQSTETESISTADGLKTELFRIDEEIPEEMVLFTRSMLGPEGTVEYDPDRRIVVLRDHLENVEHAVKFLENLRKTYEVSLQMERLESEVTSNHWAKDARYFGKPQPGESVQIEAILLMGKERLPQPSPPVRSSAAPSRKVVLEDMLLELDEKKRGILEREGTSSPKLAEVKSQMDSILSFLDSEAEHTKGEIEELAKKLEEVRNEKSDRLQHIDPASTESALIRQEIIRCNELLERIDSETSDQLVGEILRVLKKNGSPSPENSSVVGEPGRGRSIELPPEAKMLGVQPEDLGLFVFSEIETLGHTALRATVFGNDSNGIAFTTVSDYSLEFRMGHSTLGVTVALIPERKVRDQNKGIQGLVTRLNKILLDTETEVELDQPIVVGSYTHPDGTNLVLIVRISK